MLETVDVPTDFEERIDAVVLISWQIPAPFSEWLLGMSNLVSGMHFVGLSLCNFRTADAATVLT